MCRGSWPAELGVRLPSNYRAFIDLYGSVTFAGEWGVRTPARRPGTDDSPGGLAGWRFENDTEFRAQVEMEDLFRQQVRAQVFPDPGGLLGWGRNSDHDHCCWLTADPDPDRWPVVVWFQGELDRFDGGFAEFLTAVLSGDYVMEEELLVRPDPDDEWGVTRPAPLWAPGPDWAGKDWRAVWALPTGSTAMPWRLGN
ncbi:SMI1/KNR4 family protein [Kitasatospora sp. NPDC092286]|uniref:SMI1/KNR4 family protein n=1 Tax=Kitasatospora sp. NPDC092286 TaxID=3364087 RepID=UPI0037FF387B